MKKYTSREWIAVAAGVIVILILFFPFINKIFFSDSSSNYTLNQTLNMTDEQKQPVSESDALIMKDEDIGTGEVATNGSLVTVHYTGRLEDGTVFDSSVSRGEPFQFPLGYGSVIKGWDLGVAGMKIGGKRQLTIKSEYAYGSAGIKNPQTGEYLIPANATLIFDVELLGVQSTQQ